MGSTEQPEYVRKNNLPITHLPEYAAALFPHRGWLGESHAPQKGGRGLMHQEARGAWETAGTFLASNTYFFFLFYVGE